MLSLQGGSHSDHLGSDLLRRTLSKTLDLIEGASDRVVGIACADLSKSFLASLARLPVELAATATKFSARFGASLRGSLPADGECFGQDLDVLALWVQVTVQVLFKELKCRGDWTNGVTMAGALGLDAEGKAALAPSVRFQDTVFSCVSECICSRLKEEAAMAEERV